jgi:transcription elongation factor
VGSGIEENRGDPSYQSPQLDRTDDYDREMANDVLFNSRSLKVSKQTLKTRNSQDNELQVRPSAYTLEEVVQLANTRRHTQVDGLVTKVHDETAKQRGVDLEARQSLISTEPSTSRRTLLVTFKVLAF